MTKHTYFGDIETYQKYDGSLESETDIKSKMPSKEMINFFENNKKIGCYYPVLKGNQDFTLGGLRRAGRKRTDYFNKKEDMKKVIMNIVEQGITEEHNPTFIFHNTNFDIPRIFAEEIREMKEVREIGRNSKIWKITPLININLECQYCNNKWVFSGGEEITKCPLCHKNKKVPCGIIIDTMNFIGREDNKALEQIGKELGINKLTMPIEIKNPDELKEYLERDIIIIEKFIEALSNALKNLSQKPKRLLTAGHLSMSYFQTWIRNKSYCKLCGNKWNIKEKGENCEKCKVKGIAYSSYIYKGKGRAHQTKFRKEIRNAFKGAMCKCFQQGVFNEIANYDINGLYPFSATTMEVPDPISEREINPNEYSREEIMNMMGIMEVSIKMPPRNIGLLPFRWNGKGIYYPHNEKGIKNIRGWHSIKEVKFAIKRGAEINEIHRVIIWKPLPFHPLKELMLELYELRKKSNGIFKRIYKLLMNSLLLKFSQFKGNPEYTRSLRDDVKNYLKEGWEIIGDDIYIKDGKKISEYILSREGHKKFPRYAIPIWSVLVVSEARMNFYKELEKINFSDLIYCDTDGFHIKNAEKYEKELNIGSSLGEFKDEFITASKPLTADYLKEKWYFVYDKEGELVKCATSGSKSRTLSPEQLRGEEDIVELRRVTTLKAIKNNRWDDLGKLEEHRLRINTGKLKEDIETNFPENYCEFRADNEEANSDNEYDE